MWKVRKKKRCRPGPGEWLHAGFTSPNWSGTATQLRQALRSASCTRALRDIDKARRRKSDDQVFRAAALRCAISCNSTIWSGTATTFRQALRSASCIRAVVSTGGQVLKTAPLRCTDSMIWSSTAAWFGQVLRSTSCARAEKK